MVFTRATNSTHLKARNAEGARSAATVAEAVALTEAVASSRLGRASTTRNSLEVVSTGRSREIEGETAAERMGLGTAGARS